MTYKITNAILCSLIAGAGCAGAGDPGEAAHGSAVTCATPRSYGAIPDDGIDDRAALQAALDSGCSPLVLEAGTYNVVTPPWPRSYSILTMPANMEIVGCDATVLAFSGNAALHDWRGIGLADNTIVHHLQVDTAALVGTSEQTHAIHALGPVTSPLVEYVTFHHPYRGMDGGDCVQLVGYPDRRIIAPIIRNNDFAVCDRSGIAFHSGVHGGQFAYNTFSNTGDQDLDGEGSGDLDGVEIGPGNTFAIGPSAQSAIAFHLQLATNFHVHDNAFNGRGLFIYGCSGCEFDHDSITLTMASPGGALEIQKDSNGVDIHDETIVRAASAGVGSSLRVQPHNSGTPANVTLANSHLTQHSGGSLIDTSGIVGLHIAGNTLTYDGPANSGFAVNALGSTAVRTTDIEVASNTFSGVFSAVVHLAGSYQGTGTASITDNTATGATRGLYCENITTAGQILGPITYANNAMPAPQCGSLVPP